MQLSLVNVISQQSGYHTVLNVIHQIPDHIMTTGMKYIEGIEFLFLDSRKQLHLCIQIAQVSERQLQFLTGLLRLQRVKQHGCLAYRLQRTVDPAGGILTSQTVNA